MSALTDRTRLGLEVLATGAVLGIAGDALLRATPWGLNAFLCTVALAAAAAWLVYRRRIAVGRDAPWLAMAAVLLGSNFAARDSNALRALDAVGLAILLALAGLSLRGVALRGRDAWEYVRSGVVAALSAWFGVWPLLARDIRWSELPTGGALRHARGAIGGALLAFPLLLAFGGLFAAADPVFRNVVATALHVDFSAVASHLAVTAFWTALTAGYFWGALIRRAPPPAADAQALSLGIVPVGTALGLVNLLFLVFVVIQLRYFFGGAELVQSATDLTYAEYARRGFFELVAASGLVLPFLLGADWQLRDASREHRSEEHTCELQSRLHLVCRLLLEKKKKHAILTNVDCRLRLPSTTPPISIDIFPNVLWGHVTTHGSPNDLDAESHPPCASNSRYAA